MKKNLTKRLICLLLVLVMLTGNLPALAAWADFTDIEPGHWAEQSMKDAYYNRLISGYDDLTIRPARAINKAEILTMLTRVLDASAMANLSGTGIDSAQWYYEATAKAVALGIIGIGETGDMGQSVTREQAFVYIAKAFQLTKAAQDQSILNRYSDGSAVSHTARAATAALLSAGYVKGTDVGAINPAGTINRAEIVTIIGRIVGSYILPEALEASTTGGVVMPAIVLPPEGEPPQEGEDKDKEPDGEPEPVDPDDIGHEELPLPNDGDDLTLPDDGEITPLTTEEPPQSTPTPDDDTADTQTDIPSEDVVPQDTDEDEDDDQETPERSPIVALSDLHLNTDVTINSFASRVNLTNITTGGRILIRSAQLDELTVSGGQISELVLASVSGSVDFAPTQNGTVDTFTVGAGTGTVRLSGDIRHVEVTGNNRTVYLDMQTLSSLTVSGTGNTIHISGATAVETINITPSAENTRLVVDGTAAKLQVQGDRATVTGSGRVEAVTVSGLGCTVDIDHDTYEEKLDYGLTGVGINLTPSVAKVPAGGGVTVTASFTGVQGDATVNAQWYINGAAAPGLSNSAFPLSASKTSACSPPITFTQDMKLSVTVGLELTYVRSGVPQRVYHEITVPIENYPDEYYKPNPIEQQTWSESYNLVKNADIITTISSVYRGNYSLSYNKDFSVEDKENFVNSNGYSSDTGYLVWLNLGTQKVNIFTGSKGNWTLKYTFVVASGKSSTPTPVGVFKTTYKQEGWYTAKYICKPVVRFKGGGYAFHSRLKSPNGSNSYTDASIGFPVSEGCIRMYDTDIQWMYNNLPNGSTVVVY